jgi:TP901 family phage tail tape measure protein
MDVSFVIRLIDQFSGPAKKLKDGMSGIGKAAREGFSGAIKDGFSVENIEQATKNAESALGKARGRLLGAFGQAMTLFAPLKAAAQFDQSFKGLEKVLDAPVDRLKQLRKFALDTSAIIPIAARDILELMSEAAQGGVPQEDLERFSTYVANAAVAFDMAGADIGERFAKLRNVYKLNQEGIEDLGDATNHLSNNMAAKASELTDFTNRGAGAAAIFKLTATQTAAVGAALISAGVVPETAARGLTGLATRILAGGKKIDAAFKSVGLSRKGFMKEMEKDAPGALVKLFETLSKSKNGMNALIELAGRDFADDFAKLLGNPELLAQAFKLVADKSKYAGSAVEEAGKQAEGAERKWDLLVNRITRLSVVLGTLLLPVALQISDRIGAIVDRVVELSEANPELTNTLVMAASGFMALSVASRVMSFALAGFRLSAIRLISAFLKFQDGRNIATGWRILSGVWRTAAGSANALGAALMFVVRSVPAVRNAIAGLAMISAASGGGLAGGLAATVLALKGFAAALVGLVAGITAPVWAIVAVLAAAGFAIYKFWDRISSFVSGFAGPFIDLFGTAIQSLETNVSKFIDTLGEMLNLDPASIAAFKSAIASAFDFSALIDGMKTALADLWATISGFFEVEKLSDGEKAGMRSAGEALANALIDGFKASFEEFYKWCAGIPSRVLAAIGKIDVVSLFGEPPEWIKWLMNGSGPNPGTVLGTSMGEKYQPKAPNIKEAVSLALEDTRPPTVNIDAPITIYGVTDPVAAGRAAASHLNGAVSSAKSGALNDGGSQ